MVFFNNCFVNEVFITKVREIYKLLDRNVDYLILSKLLTNVAELLNKNLLPHRFFKLLLIKL